YIFIKSVIALLFIFMMCQFLMTIYYNNFMPVPGYPKAYKAFKTGNYERALKQIETVITRYPDNYESLILIANIYMNQFKYNESIKYLLAAKKVEPENILSYINLSNAYTAIENFNEAIESAEKITQLSKENWNALYTIALCNMLESNFQKAIEYFNKTLEKNIPEEQKLLVHYGLYKCYLNINNEEKSKKELENFNSIKNERVIKFWQNKLNNIKDHMNKPGLFVKEAITN
ncbi:MAG: tetratricopeptide repeat protein, partial [Vampirovibrionia bacterium]